MKTTLGVGLIGCGNISSAYLARAKMFENIAFVAVSDANMSAAEQRGGEFGIPAMTPEALLANAEVDIVLNLTVPNAHFEVSKAALEAGKHVYCEKPFVLSVDQGRELIGIAESNGLRIGSAPDTILGASHQLARRLIDDGAVGAITSGACFVLSHGMEDWHPAPDFFFKAGGGPVLDVGPYYVANLVQLLGPVARVAAVSTTPSPTRRIGSGPRLGEDIPVEVPTTTQSLLHFASGAIVTLATSWDVWQHDLEPMTLFGTKGTMHVPDPNFFGGDVAITNERNPANLPEWQHAFGPPNRETSKGMAADYRTVGLAEMAQAIVKARPHRCNSAFALHVVEVLCAIERSASDSCFVAIETRCARPEPLTVSEANALLAW